MKIQGGLMPSQDMNSIRVLPETNLAVLVLSESAQTNGNVSLVFRKRTQFESCLDMKMLCSGMMPDSFVHGLPRRCRQQATGSSQMLVPTYMVSHPRRQ
jgi:hypothetical protein